MEKENIVARNVVVLFEKGLEDKFIGISEKMNEQSPSHVVLNHEDAHPHLSLYITVYPEKNIEKVKQSLAKIASETTPFNIRFNSKSCTVGFIFIDAQISAELYRLHESVVERLNAFREGHFDPDALNLPGLTEDMRKSIADYGMWAVKDLYKPHVTIGRTINLNQSEEALASLPEDIDYTAQVKSISLVETGPHGTCKKVIETYPFGQSS